MPSMILESPTVFHPQLSLFLTPRGKKYTQSFLTWTPFNIHDQPCNYGQLGIFLFSNF